MNDIQILTNELIKFRDARHWEQFHNTKDLALAISIEANIDNNLYYVVNLSDHGQVAVDYYRSRGADKNSRVADPLCRDVKNGDFRLKENSPAYQIGFKDIDMSRIGITPDYPVRFKEIVKNQLGLDYDMFNRLEVLFKPVKNN